MVQVGPYTSGALILNTGAPQGCVLIPFLSSLITSDYVSPSDSNLIIKFAEDTTVVGLIRDADESDYCHQVDELVTWCN